MDWLYPSSSYDPISNGQSPRGLSAWALSNSALANLNKTTNQLIAEGQQQNSLAGSSAPGLAAIPAGSNDPNDYGGYGQTTDVMGVLGNIASFAAGPVAFGARAIASMIANHPTVYGLDDAFSGKPTSISGRIADQFRGNIVNPNVVSPDKTASLADYGKADYGLGSDYSGTIGGPDGKNASDVGALSESQNAENNAPDGGKEGGKDGGNKNFRGGLVGYASGGLVNGATGGMADVVPAGNYDTISDGEYILPADFVAMLGDGNTRAGGRELDKAVARLRKLKYGRGKQPPAFRGTLEDLL